MSGICYQCGKRLKDAVGHDVDGVERLLDGNPVRLHKVCAKTFDSDQRKEIPTPRSVNLGDDDQCAA